MTGPSMSDTELIDMLIDLGQQLEDDLIGAADGLPDAVMARIRFDERSHDHLFARRAVPRWLAAAAVLLVVVLIAVPGPRRTIARWFGVGSVRIEPVSTSPSVPAASDIEEGTLPTTAASVIASDTVPDVDPLGLGPAVDPAAAVEATGLPLPVAPTLGEPESFHIPGGPQIVARYDVDGRTLLVAVLAGTADEPMFLKQVGPDQVTPVDVPGVDGESGRGLWITGEPHVFEYYYVDAEGEPGTQRLRLAGDTLLWERAGTTLRVEGARDLAEALEIAAAMEP